MQHSPHTTAIPLTPSWTHNKEHRVAAELLQTRCHHESSPPREPPCSKTDPSHGPTQPYPSGCPPPSPPCHPRLWLQSAFRRAPLLVSRDAATIVNLIHCHAFLFGRLVLWWEEKRGCVWKGSGEMRMKGILESKNRKNIRLGVWSKKIRCKK